MGTPTDKFHDAERTDAASKSTVSAVLNKVSDLGTSLLSLLAGLLAAALILYSSYVLYDTAYTQESARSGWDLLQYKPVILEDEPSPQSGANALAAINNDYRSWLTLYDTSIDYPVMQHPENDLYYASHDIYGNVSLTGSIYLAAANSGNLSDSYNLIYGHHMDNIYGRANNGAMFGALDAYLDTSYLESHREGVLVSPTSVYDLYAFAVVKTDAYQSRIYTVGNRMDDVLAFISTADGTDDTTTLFYDSDALDGATKIVALSTCAAANTNGRLVVFFTMTQRSLITVNAQGYEGTYDGNEHSLAGVTINYPDDTTVEYSTDGVTWTTEMPKIKDVQRDADGNVIPVTVTVRVTNETYGRATTTTTLQVNPKPVTVAADPSQKVYSLDDPTFTANVSGVIDNQTIAYIVTRPGAGTDENVGTYPNAVVPSGEQEQGNYTVTYVPAEFAITRSENWVLNANGFDGVFDGETHPASAEAVRDGAPVSGTTIEYSTDGGTTWTTTPPAIRDVEEIPVRVRATNPNYVTLEKDVVLKVTPATVTVSANAASKTYDTADPAFTASVSGLIGSDTVAYTVTRSGAGTDEEVGTYSNAIVPSGAARQGNYNVVYESADFTIVPSGNLVLTADGYTGVYDAKAHTATATVNVPTGTDIRYSIDGGTTWTRDVPSITNVGTVNVTVRATNRNYETVTQDIVLTVTPAQVTVRANESSKRFGDADPTFTATVNGVVDGYAIAYTVNRPGVGTDEAAGRYPDAITVTGAREQGNYEVTYVPADFEILRSVDWTLNATGYEGIYDGETHFAGATVTQNGAPVEGTTIEYSTDNGRTWTTLPPSIHDVGDIPVRVRATNPSYGELEQEVRLAVTPRYVTVTVDNVSKLSGDDDPAFTAKVTGLLDGDSVAYTLERDAGTTAGSYEVRAVGDAVQGNYVVRYVPGMLRIINRPGTTPVGPTETNDPNPTNTPEPGATPDPGEIEIEIEDPEPPLAKVFKPFEPKGTNSGRRVWALVNLICMILTIYILIPLLHLRAKFSRARMMKKINKAKEELRKHTELQEEDARDKARIEEIAIEERGKKAAAAAAKAQEGKPAPEIPTGDIQENEFDDAVEVLYYQVRKFLRRFRIGMVFEVVIAVLAVVVFVLTEDMRLPMVLIDRWTPLMIVLIAAIWTIDVALVRYRNEVLAEEEEAERNRKEQEEQKAAAAAAQ